MSGVELDLTPIKNVEFRSCQNTLSHFIAPS